jgi:FtsP/CotA-like multicopper oxidase with cupredoxin domain
MPSWKERLAVVAQRNRREIVKAQLSRREMVRLGLLTAGGSLIAKQGLSAGITSSNDGTLNTDGRLLSSVDLTPPSPPAAPWVQPMPRIPQKMSIKSTEMAGGQPDGYTLIEKATQRVKHQFFTFDPKTGTYGGKFPPKTFYEMTLSEFQAQLHPSYGPVTTVWGFDKELPGPAIHATYGDPVLLRIHNHLPSVKIAQDFGIAQDAIHLHNGHTPSESDGYPEDYVNSINDKTAISPLGIKDHHYPNVYAGFAAANDSVGDSREALGSCWYHDHTIDFTAQNVYKGMFGPYLLSDHLDTGNETTGLRLPSGAYDVPIMFNDFLLDDRAQLVFDLFNLDGILGDRFAANGAIQPVFDVDKRRYRLRLYNPGPSRWWEFALFDGKNYLPFWQISNDGNLLPQAVEVTSVRLSTAKRVDIIVDFSKYTASRLYLVNRLEQVNGRGPTGKTLTPGTPIVQINISGAKPPPDYSRDPADPKLGTYYLRALPDPDFNVLLAKAAKAKTRIMRFDRGNGAWQVNGKFFDENVINANPAQEAEEVWVFQNGGGGWAHPIHAHFEECRILSENGVAVQPNQVVNGAIPYSRCDIIPLLISEEQRVFFRFRDMKGRYVMHCHNVVHEDHEMMIRFDIV